MTAKQLLTELETREEEFKNVNDIVQKHRAAAICKNVWVTRSGEHLREDLEDARHLPGIRAKLESYSSDPKMHHQDTINTMFSAAEGVSRAKSLAYFEQAKSLRDKLKEAVERDEKTGTSTEVSLDAQGFPLTVGEGFSSENVLENAAKLAEQVALESTCEPAKQGPQRRSEVGSSSALEAMRERMKAALGSESPLI